MCILFIVLMKMKLRLLLFSCSVVSNSLWHHGLQHSGFLCPPLSSKYLSEFAQIHVCRVADAIHLIVCWPFSWPQSFSASGSFPMRQLFTSSGPSIGASASASVLPMNIQCWFPLGLTGKKVLLSRGLSSLLHHSLKASSFWHSAVVMVQLSMTTGKTSDQLWLWASLVTQMVKHSLGMQETRVQSMSREDPLEKEMATHSSILAWKIPSTEEPGGLQSHGVAKSQTQLSD